MTTKHQRRAESLKALEEVYEIGNDLHGLVEVLDHTIGVDLQRALVRPREKRSGQRFRIGGRANGDAQLVAANTENNAYIKWGEPCPDCGDGKVFNEAAQSRSEKKFDFEIVACGCGSWFATDSEQWLDEEAASCEACERPVETQDGGPLLCARCRERTGIKTVCAGCARLYAAKPEPVPEDPETDTKPVLPHHQWKRLCPNCKKPAANHEVAKNSTQQQFKDVAERYGSGGQVDTALSVARHLHVHGIAPVNTNDLWSETETVAAIKWLESRLVTTH